MKFMGYITREKEKMNRLLRQYEEKNCSTIQVWDFLHGPSQRPLLPCGFMPGGFDLDMRSRFGSKAQTGGGKRFTLILRFILQTDGELDTASIDRLIEESFI